MAGLLFQVIPTCLVFRAADVRNELINHLFIHFFIYLLSTNADEVTRNHRI
jgi:hypothetical protein